jgi:hypothetical protein
MDDELYVLGSTYTQEFPIWKSRNPRVDDWSEAVEGFRAGAWDPAFFLDDDGRLYLYHGSSNTAPIYGREIDRRTLQPKDLSNPLPPGEGRVRAGNTKPASQARNEERGARSEVGAGNEKPSAQPSPTGRGSVELIQLDDDVHGWERFGEANDNTYLRPFIEGAWMTKHAGKYYLQYAAPGTEFSGYADGVYVGAGPLGPFTYQEHNPFSYKPGGFARGAGHGGTFQDPSGNWWHTATIAIGVKNNFERRIGIWPAGFDEDGVLYCDTAYGDYPHYLPHARPEPTTLARGGSHFPLPLPLGEGRGEGRSPVTKAPSPIPLPKGEGFRTATPQIEPVPVEPVLARFTGWMLLNYAKPVTASSTLGGFAPNFAVDEDIRTYWSAASGEAGEHFTSDLGAVSTVRAIQVNYADQDATLMGKVPGLYHQYVVSASSDRANWEVIIDKRENRRDVPHDYVQLAAPVEARYVRIENRHIPTGKFALSGLRVFGLGHGERPKPVSRFQVLRGESDRRNAWLKWPQSADATGYVIRCGANPRKLYTSVMVYGDNEYYFRAMDGDRPYYFAIEAFNENGISARSAVVTAE